MLKNFILVASLLFVVPTLYACDACGCGMGGGGFGLLGVYRSNFIGLQYQYAGFRSLYSSGEPTGTEDAFHLASLALRWGLGDRWRLDANQSYVMNHRNSPAVGPQELEGLGDLRLNLSYVLWNSKPLGSKLTSYLEVGAGTSLPTGRYEPRLLQTHFLPDNFSPGRGAAGLQTHFLLSVYGKHVGTSLQGAGSWFAATEAGYRFGAEQRLSWQIFSELPLGKRTDWVPFTGIQLEHVGANSSRSGNAVHGTGGSAALARAGFQFRLPKLTIGLAAMLPLANSYANGEVAARNRLSAEAYYLF